MSDRPSGILVPGSSKDIKIYLHVRILRQALQDESQTHKRFKRTFVYPWGEFYDRPSRTKAKHMKGSKEHLSTHGVNFTTGPPGRENQTHKSFKSTFVYPWGEFYDRPCRTRAKHIKASKVHLSTHGVNFTTGPPGRENQTHKSFKSTSVYPWGEFYDRPSRTREPNTYKIQKYICLPMG